MTKVLKDIGDTSGALASPQVLPENRSWYDGAIGELIVGYELAHLPSSWRVLHAIPVGRQGRDIDHLVIGPGGVFVLNTKRHVDASVRVGTHVTWVRDRTERYQLDIVKVADEVGDMLARVSQDRPKVVPVLVFVQVGSFSHAGEQLVAAVQSHRLVAYLQSQPDVLTQEQVRSIADIAGRPETWGAPSTVLDEADPTVRFIGLHPPVPAPTPASTTLTTTGGSPRPPVAARHSTPRGRPVASRPGARPSRSSHSRRAAALAVAVLGPLVAIPVAIGALHVMLQIWTAALTAH